MKTKERTFLSLVLVTAAVVGVSWQPAWGQQQQEWCDQELTLGTCPPNCPTGSSFCEFGSCDFPGTRNAWIPDPMGPMLTFRIKFNIFPDMLTVSPARVQAEVNDINLDFLSSRIMFDEVTTAQWISDAQFNEIDSLSEANAMKTAHADQPGFQLNVYVTDLGTGLPGARAFATFPWAVNALTPTGGIVIDKDFFGRGSTGPSVDLAKTGILTHEIGHALGLWHTFHGSSPGELKESKHGDCGSSPNGCDCFCYERANRSTEDGDSKGDMCSDTPGRFVRQDCQGDINSDVCSGAPWNSSVDSNYMSVQNDGTCRTHFTVQQKGRTRCWSCGVLGAWIVGEGASGTCCLPGGTCSVVGPTCCADRGGTFHGEMTECGKDCDGTATSNVCNLPMNACCLLTGGTCIDTTQVCYAAQPPSMFCNGCSNGCATPMLTCPSIN